MYDSVKRFEPTFSVGAAIGSAPIEQMARNARALRNGVSRSLIGGRSRRIGYAKP